MSISLSTKPNKKYQVSTPSGKVVHFGTAGRPHYKDRTPDGAFTHLNDFDETKRQKQLAKFTSERREDGLPLCMDKEHPWYYEVNFLW